MKLITRFAPSPTGHLHVGNLRAAIFNFILARQSGGEFILRLDDTDQERSTQEFADQIKRDLDWLGIEWNRCESQSDRIVIYNDVADLLRSSGYLYECFETPEELDLKRKKQLSMGRPPVYDRSALKLTSKEILQLRSERKSHWRFKLDHDRVDWTDGILGSISIDASSVSDPILIRGDGQYLYTLASVVDDISFNINYVIRGSDHVTNTATQVQLFKALASSVPQFAHHSLLVGASGEPLSKRLKNLSLLELKNSGLESRAIFFFIASLGSSKSIDLESTVEKLVQDFEICNFGPAPTKFDAILLSAISTKCLSRMGLKEISDDLETLGIPEEIQSDFWEMASENVTLRADLITLWGLCVKGVSPKILKEDQEFIAVCRKLMPLSPRDKNSWASWISDIKSNTSRSGKSLFLPLRRALTGKDKGPDMNKLFPLLQSINF